MIQNVHSHANADNVRQEYTVWFIRESVDSLYRDGKSEILRDPRTKRLKTR